MTIWETIANEALENLGDRARDILAERRAEGRDDSANDITEELSFGGEVDDQVEGAHSAIYLDEVEAFGDILGDRWASECYAEEVSRGEDLAEAVRKVVLLLAVEEVERQLEDLAEALREDFPDLEDDYSEEAGA